MAHVPNEAIADVHKALIQEARAQEGCYGSQQESKSVVSELEEHLDSAGKTILSEIKERCLSDSSGIKRPTSEPPQKRLDEVADLKTPQGFRRYFLKDKANGSGLDADDYPETWRTSFMESIRPIIRSGYYDTLLGISTDKDTGEIRLPTIGQASIAWTTIALLKSFVGSGVMFLPSAFAKGGWLYSVIMFFTLAFVTLCCTSRLLRCCEATGCQSYADVAYLVAGHRLTFLVQVSLVLTQFGICIVYMTFITLLGESLGLASPVSLAVTLLVTLPLCQIRSVEWLEFPNLIGDLLIVVGLAVVLTYCGSMLHTRGLTTHHVAFNPGSQGISLGVACLAFEGVPLVLPIRNAMRQKKYFEQTYIAVLGFVAMLYVGFGMTCYLALGSQDLHTIVLLNLPKSIVYDIIKVGYMLALAFSMPLQFLPAARITEMWLFGPARTQSTEMKRGANVFRACEILAFAAVAMWDRGAFSTFIAYVGSFCAVPIMFIYPAVFHLQLCSSTLLAKAADVLMIACGFTAMVVTATFGS
jgi:solute carrier family 36 (proton-coupled amino acid transporter)